jgi:hypothetical protein
MIDSNSPLAQGRLPRCLRRFERLTACVLHFEADPESAQPSMAVGSYGLSKEHLELIKRFGNDRKTLNAEADKLRGK